MVTEPYFLDGGSLRIGTRLHTARTSKATVSGEELEGRGAAA
jgi:hypothetical protein